MGGVNHTIQYLDPWKVITAWDCPECAKRIEVDVTFFEHNGTPMCLECPDQYLEFNFVYLVESEEKDES
jgi:hypothetical protein